MFIYSNLAISLDGKIAPVDRSLFLLGTAADHRQMQVLRKNCDAIVVGASTLRSIKLPMIVNGAKKQPINVVLSSRLEGLSPRWKFFRDPDLRRILLVSSAVSPERVEEFSPYAEIIVLGPGAVGPQTVRQLRKRGVENLLVEGGGEIMWEFIRHDLIEEFHVTLTPRILGGAQAPTLVDGTGFTARTAKKLELMKSKRIGDELYLTYRLRKSLRR
jgi:5-amino-6-(5-phosphoribosylamino)uracil reductase